ncbi:MAG: NAD(+) synthase [Clostridiales Family XIII bacterium]|jgi:NAD+ synthase (glutamine-hydrolysing)|nr:NAD(+) synthase [Clostridiales Family XIII bacterium]
MIEGFVRVAAVSPEIRVADCGYNAERIEEAVRAAAGKGARIVTLPELSITGYTCGDLFLQDTLLDSAKAALARLVARSEGREEVVIVGLPLLCKGKLYNVAAVYSDGELLAFIPKSHLPNYGEFYERRHFAPAFSGIEYYDFTAASSAGAAEDDEDDEAEGGGTRLKGIGVLSIYDSDDDFDDDEDDEDDDDEDAEYYEDIPFGTDIIFKCEEEPALTFAVEICEDLWAPNPPSVRHTANGAMIIANLSAGNETTGKASYRRLLTCGQSGRLLCGYVYASAGLGESTQDMVFSGHSIIAENGTILAENPPFGSLRGGIVISDIDVRGLARDRRYNTSFVCAGANGSPADEDDADREYEEVLFSQPDMSFAEAPKIIAGDNVIPFGKRGAERKEQLYRRVDPHPFVPQKKDERAERCEEILAMQSSGLAKRLTYTGAETAVIGVSGGLDSTLALLVTVRAMRRAGKDESAIRAITMPGFGTTDKTKNNAEMLCEALGVPFREIDITSQVKEHLKAIGHSEEERDVTYENAQARVRTLVLMDIANKENGLVVGTGDLSELALGWATYNGDHMSMYGVNAGVPKSLVRHIIKYAADAEAEKDPGLSAVLEDIIATPVSPELLPPEDGQISQRTEDIIGPYELHDFFLYHMVRWGRRPRVILALAKIAFAQAHGEAQEEPPQESPQGRYREESSHRRLQREASPVHVQDELSPAHTQGELSPAHVQDELPPARSDAGDSNRSYHGKGVYTEDEIRGWLKVFIRRFFANQFKRSTLPDGPKIGSVTLSPRADWRMPPDASPEEWLKDLE